MIRITEKKIHQNKGLLGIIVGVVILVVGLIIFTVGIYLLFFTSIVGDALQLSEYNLLTSLVVLLGDYLSLIGLHLILQKLKSSTKAYMLIVVGILVIIIAAYGYIMAGVSPGYRGVWGFVTLLLYGFGPVIFGLYLLSSYYKPRKNLVYANVVMIVIVLIIIILFII